VYSKFKYLNINQLIMKYFYTIIFLFGLSVFESKAQNPQEFFLDDWQPKTAVSPEYVNTPQPTEPATVTVTIDLKDTISKVSKYVYGNNAIPWAGKLNTKASLIEDINKLSPNVLRWPGGNLSNEHFWDAKPGKGPTDIPPTMKINDLNAGMTTASWVLNLNDYYDFLEKTNSTGCICVNYSYARYGTGPDPVTTAAHYAANWVRYDKGRTKLWEIGNENHGSWEAGYQIDTSLNQDGQPKIITGELYGQHCRVFIDSMKSAAAEIDSEIKIGVGLVENYVSWDEVMRNWNSGVLPQVAGKADFLIVHSYYTPYNENSSVATILNSASKTKDYKNYVLADLKKYTDLENLPVALTEWNIFATGSKQAVSYINGIHATLVLGELIKNQYGQAMRWDLVNGWSDGNDHGLFAASDEPGVPYYSPHAPFYYMYYFQKYFGDVMVKSTVSGNSSILTYASSFSSGESGVVVVNKGTAKQIVELDMKNYPEAKSFYRYVLTGGSDNGDFSRKVSVNGETTTLEGGGPKNYETLSAYGKSIDGKAKFEAPPLSVTYVLVSGDSIPVLTAINDVQTPYFKMYPNPTWGEITIQSPGFDYNKLTILNLTGKRVFEQILTQAARESESYNFNLNPGVYILTLSNGSQQISRKLVVK